MKKIYLVPAIQVVELQLTNSMLTTSATDATGNVGLQYGGGTSGNVSSRTKDAGDWDIWGED